MNQSEKRRQELLRSAREWYGSSYSPPAIHPRYRNLYGELYGQEERPSSFRIRFFAGCLLFLIYILMDYCDLEIGPADSQTVANMIQQDTEITDIWEDLL